MLLSFAPILHPTSSTSLKSDMPSIELLDLKNKPFHDLEKPKLAQVASRAYLYLAVQLVSIVAVYVNYAYLQEWHPLLAPTLLGASSAGLAQSISQCYKNIASEGKLFKFLVWGLINGCFTELWIDMLMARVTNVVSRVVIDQTIGASCFQLAFSLLSAAWDLDSTTSPRTTYLRSMRLSYCYWPFVSAAIFTLAPEQRMVMCSCLANFVWNLILTRLG